MKDNLKTKDDLALEAYETTLKKAKEAVRESEKQGIVIYVNFKKKKVIRYEKS